MLVRKSTSFARYIEISIEWFISSSYIRQHLFKTLDADAYGFKAWIILI